MVGALDKADAFKRSIISRAIYHLFMFCHSQHIRWHAYHGIKHTTSGGTTSCYSYSEQKRRHTKISDWRSTTVTTAFTASKAHLPLGHLGHAPPLFELREISHMVKNATYREVAPMENHQNCCNLIMSYFKTKMHPIRFRLGLCPRPRCGTLQRSQAP